MYTDMSMQVEAQALEIQGSLNASHDDETAVSSRSARRTAVRANQQEFHVAISDNPSSTNTTSTSTTEQTNQQSSEDPEHGSSSNTSSNRSSPLLTARERDSMLRNAVIRLQLESLAVSGP
jgi:hypothetical protein